MQLNCGPETPSWSQELLNRKVDRRFTRQREEWRGRHVVKGKALTPTAVEMISNDYLSISGHPQIVEAIQTSLDYAKNQNIIMSGVFLEEDQPQCQLERKFANWLGSDDTVLCQSGYAANIGILQSLLDGESFPVYIDMMAHMSLWDGVTLGGGTAHAFRHNSVKHLNQLIDKHGPGIVIADSIYSISGGIAPLKKLVEDAYSKECIIIIDESHSLGTHGKNGHGLVAELNLQDKVHFRTASLAKAFAGRAGLVTMPGDYKEVFNTASKPFIFSSALLPSEIAGLSATLDLIKSADDRRAQLKTNTESLLQGLSNLGYDLGETESHIIPLATGSEWNTITLRDELEAFEIFGAAFCDPATAKNRALIRLSVSAGLTPEEIERTLFACDQISKLPGASEWRCLRHLRSIEQTQPLPKAA